MSASLHPKFLSWFNACFRYFLGYEVVKKAVTPAGSSPSDLNLGAIIFAGGMAGVTMWSIAIPPDVITVNNAFLLCPYSIRFQQVIKSRIQTAPAGTYSGILDCARKTIAADGVRALWKGFGPAMARVRLPSDFVFSR